LNRFLEPLREAPAAVPALAAVALFVSWATNQAGYPVTHWAPGGLVMLALVAVAAGAVGLRASEVPRPVRLALGALAAYAALSFASIAWAAVPGEAWVGADRTLLYLLVFALFACWPLRARGAALVLATWTLAMIGLAAYTGVHLAGASGAQLQRLAFGGRLTFPSEYANANAAEWLMPFWAALLLARSARLPWALRGALAGGAVVLAEVALLSQSRGSLYATPVMVVLVFALLPGRARTFALLAPVALGVAAGAPFVLRVDKRLEAGGNAPAAAHEALLAVALASLAVAAAVALASLAESRLRPSPATAARVHRGVSALAALTLVAVLAGGWALAGNPLRRAEHDWDTFKGGDQEEAPRGDRLLSGLGSSRYDVYRVALDEFLRHPLVGLGADNFQEQYLVHGRSTETPRYPHSVEMRTIAETGAVGVALALAGLAGALLAAWRAIRGPDALAGEVAAAALAAFAYWAVHGSFDWFFEIAGLGAPAFALLGMACGLCPRERAPAGAAREGGWWRRRAGRASLAVAALAAAGALALPWLSELETQSAAKVWALAPATAYSRLRQAARLNPLSAEPYVLAGNIAVRYGSLARARGYFHDALARAPHEAYARLELGAIASTLGERMRALAELRRAVSLEPRDALARQALKLARDGEAVDVRELNRTIYEEGARFP